MTLILRGNEPSIRLNTASLTRGKYVAERTYFDPIA